MKIVEQPNPKIKITKFEFTCDDSDESIPDPLPQSSFFMTIISPPGSGKSNLLLNLFCKRGRCFNKKFDRVFWLSPSTETMKEDWLENIPDEQKFNTLDEEILQTILSSMESTGEKVVIVIDDLITQIKKNMSSLLRTIYNRRHCCGAGGSLSVIITSQVYNKIPLEVRKAITHIALMSDPRRNRKEWSSIREELFDNINEGDANNILNYAFQNKYDMLFINVSTRQIYRNFCMLVLD